MLSLCCVRGDNNLYTFKTTFTGATFIVGWLLSFSQGAVPRGAHVNATELCSAVSDVEQVRKRIFCTILC
jgi:hypothetical protein